MNSINCYNKYNFIASNYNILIIEDSTSMIKIIDNIFSNHKFNIFLSTTLKEAREILSLNRIDYVILDINLPDGHGYELIKELSDSKSKIIVLTSQTDSQLKEASYQRGVVDFVN